MVLVELAVESGMHLGQLPHGRIAGRGCHLRQRGGADGHGEVPEILARDVERRPRVTGQVLRLDAIGSGGDPDQPGPWPTRYKTLDGCGRPLGPMVAEMPSRWLATSAHSSSWLGTGGGLLPRPGSLGIPGRGGRRRRLRRRLRPQDHGQAHHGRRGGDRHNEQGGRPGQGTAREPVDGVAAGTHDGERRSGRRVGQRRLEAGVGGEPQTTFSCGSTRIGFATSEGVGILAPLVVPTTLVPLLPQRPRVVLFGVGVRARTWPLHQIPR